MGFIQIMSLHYTDHVAALETWLLFALRQRAGESWLAIVCWLLTLGRIDKHPVWLPLLGCAGK